MLAWDPPGVIPLPGPKVSLEKFLGQWFSNVRMQRYHLGRLAPPSETPSSGLGWGLRTDIPNKFPGGADAAFQGYTWEPRQEKGPWG